VRDKVKGPQGTLFAEPAREELVMVTPSAAPDRATGGSTAVLGDDVLPPLEPGLQGFLEQIALLAEEEAAKEDDTREKVSLMTVHTAKGLEFEHVFLVGLEDGLFPNARVICQRADYEYFMKDESLHREYRKELTDIAGRLTLIDGDLRFADGLSLERVGGHTPGSQTVTVRTQDGPVIISGDVAMHRQNVAFCRPVGLSVNAEQSRRAIERIVQSGCAVLPSHDWMDGADAR
jgi:hypothetical protein